MLEGSGVISINEITEDDTSGVAPHVLEILLSLTLALPFFQTDIPEHPEENSLSEYISTILSLHTTDRQPATTTP